MPKLTVEGYGSFEVEEGTKLALALEDHGIPILHRCGGNSRCATCRVEVISGDPGVMKDQEAQILEARGVDDPKIRLACQIRVTRSLKVRPLMTMDSSGFTDPGPRPTP